LPITITKNDEIDINIDNIQPKNKWPKQYRKMMNENENNPQKSHSFNMQPSSPVELSHFFSFLLTAISSN